MALAHLENTLPEMCCREKWISTDALCVGGGKSRRTLSLGEDGARVMAQLLKVIGDLSFEKGS